MKNCVKSLYLSVLFVLVSISCFPQQDLTKDYTPLVSKGKLPEDFVKPASIKANEELAKLKKKGGKKIKEKGRFIISNAFFIDNLIKSGKILYGDPISSYVNKVAKELHLFDGNSKTPIRIYIVKSPVVNAYAFDSGVIFVTTGLISQLENEAQLAFVLSHELVHIKKKHSINAHIEFLSIEKNKRSFNKNGTNILLRKSSFSKKQESEADEEGFAFFEKSNYDYASIDGLFDVFQFSYLPFDEVEFDKTFFNDNHLQIPESYFLGHTKDIYSNENYNDSLSSHPNIKKRREKMELKVSGKDNKDRKKFIVSEQEFIIARDLARFETCRMYMQDLEYPNAVYSAYLLLKKYPNNLYLKKLVGRALYETAVYRTSYNKYEFFLNYEKGYRNYKAYKLKSAIDKQLDYTDSIQGASQQVYHCLKKMTGLELSVLALKRNWLLNQQENYKDAYTNEVCDSLISILKNKYDVKLDNFSKTPKKNMDSTLLTTEKKTDPKKEESKYEKIKRKGGKNRLSEENFARYALVDILEDPKFVKAFKSIEQNEKGKKSKDANRLADKKKNKKSETEDADTKGKDEYVDNTPKDSLTVSYDTYLQSVRNDNNTELKKLGIDKVIIVDPAYMKVDERKKQQTQYFAAEKGLDRFTDLIKETADAYGVSYDVLKPNDFSENDIEKYNDLSMFNDWVSERFSHGSFSTPMVLSNDFKTKLISKYHTSHIIIPGVIVATEPSLFRQYPAMILLGGVLGYWPAELLYFRKVFIASNETLFFTMVFDIQTGKMELFNQKTIDMNDKTDVLTAMLSNTMYQIKTPPKVKGN